MPPNTTYPRLPPLLAVAASPPHRTTLHHLYLLLPKQPLGGVSELDLQKDPPKGLASASYAPFARGAVNPGRDQDSCRTLPEFGAGKMAVGAPYLCRDEASYFRAFLPVQAVFVQADH